MHTALLPDQTRGGGRLALVRAPVSVSKVLTELSEAQFNIFSHGEAAPGVLLLFFQGHPAGRENLDVGHIRQGIVEPVYTTWKIVSTLHISTCSHGAHGGGNSTPASEAKKSSHQHSCRCDGSGCSSRHLRPLCAAAIGRALSL